MGWFWADQTPATAAGVPHPLPLSDASPPPGCPMHRPSRPSPPPNGASLPPNSCPYTPPDSTLSASPTSAPPRNAATLSKLNPLNWMPASISNERAQGQTVALGVEREMSTIPKGDGAGNWEYPSPQQMYNAMLRKGYTDTPQDAVESMVAVHNFLNEGAWAEIVEWESRFCRGIAHGWRRSSRGEEGCESSPALGINWTDKELDAPRLMRFQGRPGERTPKARMLQVLGWMYPAKFETEPPFDRHDWFVQRSLPDGSKKEVRYVIDYYEGPPEPTGEPVFFLDVRPAVDSPTQATERLVRWGGDVWWKASGGAVREREREEAARRR